MLIFYVLNNLTWFLFTIKSAFILFDNEVAILQKKEVWKMANIEKDNQYYEEFMSKAYDKIEREKEQRFVNLMVEIIVSMTLKE